jgi:hypothetical protein
LAINVVSKGGSNDNSLQQQIQENQKASKPTNAGAQPAATPFSAPTAPQQQTPAAPTKK